MPDSNKLLTRASVITNNEVIIAGVLEEWETFYPYTGMYRYIHEDPDYIWRH